MVYAVIMCLSQASVLPKWRNIGSLEHCCMIALDSKISGTKDDGEIPIGSPSTGARNTGGVV